MFSTLYGTYFLFLMHLKMSSANSFNLDQSKILLSGNGLTIQVWLLTIKIRLMQLCSFIYTLFTFCLDIFTSSIFIMYLFQ